MQLYSNIKNNLNETDSLRDLRVKYFGNNLDLYQQPQEVIDEINSKSFTYADNFEQVLDDYETNLGSDWYADIVRIAQENVARRKENELQKQTELNAKNEEREYKRYKKELAELRKNHSTDVDLIELLFNRIKDYEAKHNITESDETIDVETLIGTIRLSNITEDYVAKTGDYVSGLNVGDEVGLRWIGTRNSNDSFKIKDITPDYIELDIWDNPSESLLNKQRFKTKGVRVVSDEIRFDPLTKKDLYSSSSSSDTLMFIRIKPIKERFIPTSSSNDNPHWDGNFYAL